MFLSLASKVIQAAMKRFSESARDDIIGVCILVFVILRPFLAGKKNPGWAAFEEGCFTLALMLLYVFIRAIIEVWKETQEQSRVVRDIVSPIHLPDGSHPHTLVHVKVPPHFKTILTSIAVLIIIVLLMALIGVEDVVARHSPIENTVALLADPIVHIEPENAVTWSTAPGRVRGVFQLTFTSTNMDTDHMTIDESYFVAEKGDDFVFKNLGGIFPHYEHMDVLKTDQPFAFNLDFRPYSEIAKQVMLKFDGPILFGVKILVRYRRHDDGKDFKLVKGYGTINPMAPAIYDSDSQCNELAKNSGNKCPVMQVFSDGFGYWTDSINADEFAGVSTITLPPCKKKINGHFPISPKGIIRLSDLEFYMDLPGHWVPVTEMITDKSIEYF